MLFRGLSRHLGTETRPSTALLHRHVVWNQTYRRQLAEDPNATLYQRYIYTAANVAELYSWMGWLRSTETFHSEADHVKVVPPSDSESLDLPPGVGAVLLRLLPSTKSDPTKTADVVLAYATASGFHLGFQLEDLFRLRHQLGITSRYLFAHLNGSPWSTFYFKEHHLWPLLHLQQLEGDAFLRAFDGSPGNSIREKFYSMHSYRRGARSFMGTTHYGTLLFVRRATEAEVNEHGRWAMKNQGSESMPLHYLEWSIEHRLYITLLCM